MYICIYNLFQNIIQILGLVVEVSIDEISSKNIDGRRGFLSFPAGKDKNSLLRARVSATKKSLLSSSKALSCSSCTPCPAIQKGSLSLSGIRFPSQFPVYNHGINTISYSNHFEECAVITCTPC